MADPRVREVVAAEFADYLQEVVGVSEIPRESLVAMGGRVADYLGSSVRGQGSAGVNSLLWLLFSYAYEGQVPEAEVEDFFRSVNLDPAKTFAAWRTLRKEHGAEFTSVLLPGKLSEGDISLMIRSLYLQRPAES